jgi:putative ABC transport system substrate-binding protein
VIDRRAFLCGLTAGSFAMVRAAEAQLSAKVYRVGVVLEGGPYYAAIDGLRAGLQELGFEEGKQYVLHIRDVKGDLGAVAETAKNLEQEKVDVIYATANSVTLAVRRGTTKVPVVFYAGSDPVGSGLVKSFAKPGGRFTGVHTRGAEMLAKRLQILKEAVPKIRRVVSFYDPDNPGAREGVAAAREAARQLRIEVVERHVRSVDELRASLRGLKAGEADAIFYVPDAMVNSQSQLIVDAATAKKLPTMFYERTSVVAGGLASYGVSYYAVGWLTAKFIHRVLLGTSPAELPVEGFDRFELVINLKTAKALGLTIPQSVLGRADEIIQ